MPSILVNYVYGNFAISISSSLRLSLTIALSMGVFTSNFCFSVVCLRFLVCSLCRFTRFYSYASFRFVCSRALSRSPALISFSHLVFRRVTARSCSCLAVCSSRTTTTTMIMCDLLQSRLFLGPFVCGLPLPLSLYFCIFHIIYWFLSGLELQFFATCQTKDTKHDHQATRKKRQQHIRAYYIAKSGFTLESLNKLTSIPLKKG